MALQQDPSGNALEIALSYGCAIGSGRAIARFLGASSAITISIAVMATSAMATEVPNAASAAAIAMLIDEGKLKWDDPATKFLPGFQLYDPYATRDREPTVRNILDFPTLFASARNGWATTEQGVEGEDLKPLFEAIVEHVPAPGRDESGPLQALVTNLDSSPYHGRLAVCRIQRGTLKSAQEVALCTRSGDTGSTRSATPTAGGCSTSTSGASSTAPSSPCPTSRATAAP